MKYEVVDNQVDWQAFVSTRTEANFLQSWQWGEVHTQTGHKVLRQALRRDGAVISGFQAIIKDAKRGRYMEIPGGPLIEWRDEAVVKLTTETLRQLAKRHRCVFVRMRPQALASEALSCSVAQYGWRPAPMHLHAEHTSILDLDSDDETLLKNMRQQTRYEVRRTTKREVEVSQASSRQAIKAFYDLQTSTALRQHFIPSSERFLLACQEQFGDSLVVYTATKHGELLNMSVVIYYGHEADYFEAASTVAARKEPGAYAIVWKIIQDARARGLQRLNLWGTAPPNSPHHRYAGVTTFKNGFGGEAVHFLPAHDLVMSPSKYALNWTIETVRKKRRKL